MTRVWTREGLDQVWPLPGRWRWNRLAGGDGWAAELQVTHTDWVEVWADGDHVEHTDTCEDIPGLVFVAVWGAHLGHDSPDWMACKMDEQATKRRERWDRTAEPADGAIGDACEVFAAMLRRGRVAE